jgi:iron(III) transport system ATP-binding protein
VTSRISFERVGKTYPGGNQALRGISLDVPASTFLVLLGPSGSGKTTLLRCLAGIERVTSGSITLGGRVVAGPRVHVPPEQRDLSMVFQDYALWPHMTAAANVAFALRRRGLDRASCHARALALLERVGLGSLASRYPNELSGGEQQRVALARALIADTGLILADEPLSNLDADLRERMRVEISSLVREAAATTVYITHDQAEAFALADIVGVLDDGRLVQAGTPEDVYGSPATPFVARFTGLAGELTVQVRSRSSSSETTVVPAAPGSPAVSGSPAADSGVEAITARAADDGLRPGDPALLLIRPTGVRLASIGQHHLLGRVTDVAFRGRGYEYAVDIPGHGRLTGIFARHRATRGDQVGLRLDPDGCHVFPATPASPASPASPVSDPHDHADATATTPR